MHHFHFLNSYHGRRSFLSFPHLFLPTKSHPSIFESSFNHLFLQNFYSTFLLVFLSVNKLTSVWKAFISPLCQSNFSFLSFLLQPKPTAVFQWLLAHVLLHLLQSDILFWAPESHQWLPSCQMEWSFLGPHFPQLLCSIETITHSGRDCWLTRECPIPPFLPA